MASKVTVPDACYLVVGNRQVPLRLVRHPRARRYLLRLQPDGSARVTVPRGGTVQEAQAFAVRHVEWLDDQLQRQAQKPSVPATWASGTKILWRGELVTLQSPSPGQVQLGETTIPVGEPGNSRPALQRYLLGVARRELPPRVMELAQRHQVEVARVTIRNQRSRWGSCSRRGNISLNWRLVQMPPAVSDYIILHELMHRRQMNHSDRFWREVAMVCPDYQQSLTWLKRNTAWLK